jgi:hypothetical protein
VLPAPALTRGYALSFRVGAAVLAVAGLLALMLLERVTAAPRTALAEVPADGRSAVGNRRRRFRYCGGGAIPGAAVTARQFRPRAE